MVNEFDIEYHNLVRRILDTGEWVHNERTGKGCLLTIGEKCTYDMSNGRFPALTTKRLYYKAMIGELLGFIRGCDSAQDFRELGCGFWDANANESPHWLANPNRKGVDHLGRIYGVQAREWVNRHGKNFDQLAIVIDKLNNGIDDRRLIVNHWNPGELDEMSLPPCHNFYQLHLVNGSLNLSMYQRSCDVPLGVPMNVASYALLLMLIAQITGHRVGRFVHFMGNTHIYEDQLEMLREQITREPYMPPKMEINGDIKSLGDLETWVTAKDFNLVEYEYHPPIQFPFSA